MLECKEDMLRQRSGQGRVFGGPLFEGNQSVSRYREPGHHARPCQRMIVLT